MIQDCCRLFIWFVIAVAVILLLLMMSKGSNSPLNEREVAVVYEEEDYIVTPESNPYEVSGGGCGCGDIQEITGGSHAGKILSQVDVRVRNHNDLAALARGGSPRDSAYVCLGGQWHRANNLNAYRGMITGGSANSLRFSNRNTELIMGGAPAGVLSKVQLPAFRSVDALRQAVQGGQIGKSKYCAALTGGGKVKWFST